MPLNEDQRDDLRMLERRISRQLHNYYAHTVEGDRSAPVLPAWQLTPMQIVNSAIFDALALLIQLITLKDKIEARDARES